MWSLFGHALSSFGLLYLTAGLGSSSLFPLVAPLHSALIVILAAVAPVLYSRVVPHSLDGIDGSTSSGAAAGGGGGRLSTLYATRTIALTLCLTRLHVPIILVIFTLPYVVWCIWSAASHPIPHAIVARVRYALSIGGPFLLWCIFLASLGIWQWWILLDLGTAIHALLYTTVSVAYFHRLTAIVHASAAATARNKQSHINGIDDSDERNINSAVGSGGSSGGLHRGLSPIAHRTSSVYARVHAMTLVLSGICFLWSDAARVMWALIRCGTEAACAPVRTDALELIWWQVIVADPTGTQPAAPQRLLFVALLHVIALAALLVCHQLTYIACISPNLSDRNGSSAIFDHSHARIHSVPFGRTPIAPAHLMVVQWFVAFAIVKYHLVSAMSLTLAAKIFCPVLVVMLFRRIIWPTAFDWLSCTTPSLTPADSPTGNSTGSASGSRHGHQHASPEPVDPTPPSTPNARSDEETTIAITPNDDQPLPASASGGVNGIGNGGGGGIAKSNGSDAVDGSTYTTGTTASRLWYLLVLCIFCFGLTISPGTAFTPKYSPLMTMQIPNPDPLIVAKIERLWGPVHERTTRVPPILHLTLTASLSKSSTSWSFLHYLCIQSALRNGIAHVFVHYIVDKVHPLPSGEWWDRTRKDVTLVPVPDVKHIWGRPVLLAAHKSDVIRLHALRMYGGLYMDTDVIVVSSLTDVLLNATSELVVSGESGKDLVLYGYANGVMSGTPNAQFLNVWFRHLRTAFAFDCWNCHSVLFPFEFTQRIRRQNLLAHVPSTLPGGELDRWITAMHPHAFYRFPPSIAGLRALFSTTPPPSIHSDALTKAGGRIVGVHWWSSLVARRYQHLDLARLTPERLNLNTTFMCAVSAAYYNNPKLLS